MFYKLYSMFCLILFTPSNELPKTFYFLPKWRNFAKSGHTWLTGEQQTKHSQVVGFKSLKHHLWFFRHLWKRTENWKETKIGQSWTIFQKISWNLVCSTNDWLGDVGSNPALGLVNSCCSWIRWGSTIIGDPVHRRLLLKLYQQPRSHLVVEGCIQQGLCTVPHPSKHMPCSLQEKTGRWCHRSVCLVLTIEVYAPVKVIGVVVWDLKNDQLKINTADCRSFWNKLNKFLQI